MKRFVITESEKNNIREMYGMLKEQTIPKKPVKDFSEKPKGVTLSDGVTYKLPKIKNETDLFNFTDILNGELSDFIIKVVGKDRAFAYPLTWDSDRQEPKDVLSYLLRKTLYEFLRVHAITGQIEPYTFEELKKLTEIFSKDDKYQISVSPYFFAKLYNVKFGISGDSKNIYNYYQNLLKQKLG